MYMCTVWCITLHRRFQRFLGNLRDIYIYKLARLPFQMLEFNSFCRLLSEVSYIDAHEQRDPFFLCPTVYKKAV